METGSEERYVRCRRCHGVFEAGLANCSRCGTAYVPTADESATQTGSFVDRYQGTEFAEPEIQVAARPPAARPSMGLILSMGAGLVIVAAVLGAMVMLGTFDVATPTPRIVVAAITPSPSPSPTLPPAVTRTLEQLADPDLNMHMSIRTTVSVNARVTGHSSSSIVNMEVDCAGGNEAGTNQTGNISQEWRLVNGTYYVRQLPGGTWHAKVGITPFIVLSPLFSLTDSRQLQYLGPDEKNGVQADKLESTAWWTPDVGKVSGLDVTTLSMSPQHTQLFLWVASDGSPVYASFRAWTDATDGTNLLDIETTYTFTNLGEVEPIPSPTMK